MNKEEIKFKSIKSLTKSNGASSLFGANIIPGKNQELRNKAFFLYVLEKNGFSNISSFNNMIKELKGFNEQLISGCQIKNFVRVYYLYKSLYERMNQISVFCKNAEDAKARSNQIQQWFFQQKEKIRQIKRTQSRLMAAKEDLIQDQNLRKTMSNIKIKRQNQVYQVMSKSTYSQFFQSKQQNFQQTASRNSQTLSQTNQIFPRFQNTSKISNTSNTSTNLNHRKTLSTFDQISTISNDNQKNNKHKWNTSTKPIKQNSTFYLVSDLVKKDKEMQQIDAPDNIDFYSQKKADHELHEQKYIKNQKIKFLNKQTKLKSEQLLKRSQNLKSTNKKDFISLNKQIKKFRQEKSRFRLQVNRKIQSYRYLSQISEKNIVKKNRIISIVEPNLQNLSKQINLNSQNILQIEQNKFKNVNITLEGKSHSSLKQVNARYLDHLNKKSQRSQQNQQQNFQSQKLKSRENHHKIFSHLNLEEPIITLTDYKSRFAWQSRKTLPIIRAIEQNSIDNHNIEARQNAFIIKSKLVNKQVALQCHKLNGGLRINVDKLIQKNKQFQGTKKHLFSNPFFVVKKAKVKKNRGIKQK